VGVLLLYVLRVEENLLTEHIGSIGEMNWGGGISVGGGSQSQIWLGEGSMASWKYRSEGRE